MSQSRLLSLPLWYVIWSIISNKLTKATSSKLLASRKPMTQAFFTSLLQRRYCPYVLVSDSRHELHQLLKMALNAIDYQLAFPALPSPRKEMLTHSAWVVYPGHGIEGSERTPRCRDLRKKIPLAFTVSFSPVQFIELTIFDV